MLQFLPNMTTVVAAIIERDGLVLICQRKAGQRHALQWEFPGGKLEPGESLQAALKRELEEELAIRAAIGSEVTRYEYRYPGRDPILLVFYRVRDFEDEPVNIVFEKIVWEKPDRLRDYDFVDGDVDFIKSFR